jgi:enoyl-CoA hydratase
MSELVSYTVAEPGIALIVIERADKMNALNEDVIQGLRSAWQQFADSHEKVALLAAAGDRAFSVGADIKDAPREMWQGVPSIGVELYKPVIAAVHGWCIAKNAVFKYPEAQVGFTGGLVASAAARLPHKIAMEFMLLGQDFPAQRAYEAGMVNQVVPNGTQREAAMKYARILAQSGAARSGDAEAVFAGNVEQKPRRGGCTGSSAIVARSRQRGWRRRSAGVHRETPARFQRSLITLAADARPRRALESTPITLVASARPRRALRATRFRSLSSARG